MFLGSYDFLWGGGGKIFGGTLRGGDRIWGGGVQKGEGRILWVVQEEGAHNFTAQFLTELKDTSYASS